MPPSKHIIFWYILLFILIQLIGLNYEPCFEEFRDYEAYHSILHGKLPYVDYRWVYGPIGPFFYALIFRVFGSELLVLRITAVIFGCLGILLAYSISKFLLPRKTAAFAGFLAISAFFTFPAHTYNHYLGMLSNLAASLMVFRFIESSKRGDLFIAGIFSGVSYLVNPLTFGIEISFSIIALLGFIGFAERQWNRPFFRDVFIYLCGVSLAALPVYLSILSRAPFERVFELYWSHERKFAGLPLIQISLPRPDMPWDILYALRSFRYILFRDIANPSLFYLLAIITSSIALVLSFKWLRDGSRRIIACGIFFLSILALSKVIYFLYSGPYLTFLGRYYLYPAVILLVFLVRSLLSDENIKQNKTIRTVIISSCIIAGLSFAVLYHGYRISNFFLKRWYTMRAPFVKGIMFNGDHYNRYILPSEYIKNSSAPDDKVFVMFYDPAYCVLSERPPLFPEDVYMGLTPYRVMIDPARMPHYEGPALSVGGLILERMERDKPLFALDFVMKKYVYGAPPVGPSSSGIGPEAEKYIRDNYYLAKTFPYSNDESEIRVYRRKR